MKFWQAIKNVTNDGASLCISTDLNGI